VTDNETSLWRRFLNHRAIRRASRITPFLLALHVVLNALGVGIAAKETHDLGVSFITPAWLVRAVVFVIGLPLVLWGFLWLLALVAYVWWERRGLRAERT
jgi:hypothetical protein